MNLGAADGCPRQLPAMGISADAGWRLRVAWSAPRAAAALLLGLVAWLICAGCRSSEARPTGDQRAAESQFVYAVRGDFPPNLGTNEAMQIALTLAREHRIRLADYACASLIFWGNTTNTRLTNKWVVTFLETPPVPDSDFSVIIDDSTRKAELWRP